MHEELSVCKGLHTYSHQRVVVLVYLERDLELDLVELILLVAVN